MVLDRVPNMWKNKFWLWLLLKWFVIGSWKFYFQGVCSGVNGRRKRRKEREGRRRRGGREEDEKKEREQREGKKRREERSVSWIGDNGISSQLLPVHGL